jgi:hypothetical protein
MPPRKYPRAGRGSCFIRVTEWQLTALAPRCSGDSPSVYSPRASSGSRDDVIMVPYSLEFYGPFAGCMRHRKLMSGIVPTLSYTPTVLGDRETMSGISMQAASQVSAMLFQWTLHRLFPFKDQTPLRSFRRRAISDCESLVWQKWGDSGFLISPH